ncbi:hypothetical protein GCM10010246_52830 [Streptomyces cuspidosporus]|uniref:NACHT domain-containing protein n=1 Tax=Streptomyces cuspidosporus TaxID=66882 RepID=A0ABP5TMY8_9ACTN
MSAEVAAINLGRTLATRVVRLWLDPRTREQESRMDMSALIRRRIPGLRAQRSVERQFEQIADAVAARREPMCGHEFGDLDEGGRQAALRAVTAAFARADLSDEAILGSDANPAELARRVRTAAPPPAGLGEAATGFYELLLAECCDCYVQVLRRLPVFTERGITELLGRVGELGTELSRVLERLPVRSLYAPQGADQDAAFRREYLEFVSRTLDDVELFSFTAGQAPRTKLSVAYISLRVSTDEDGRAARRTGHGSVDRLRAGIGAWDTADQESSASVRVEAALKQSPRVLLRGEAGSGKTTLLNWLAVTAARGAFDGDLADWNGLVPVLLKLRQYAARELPRLEQLLDFTAGPLTGHMPAAWVDRQFQAGRVLLLVDGLDELVASERRKVRDWLRLLLGAYPDTRAVVTTRPTAASGDWLRSEGFAPVGLERMTPADLRVFVQQWHQAVAAALRRSAVCAGRAAALRAGTDGEPPGPPPSAGARRDPAPGRSAVRAAPGAARPAAAKPHGVVPHRAGVAGAAQGRRARGAQRPGRTAEPHGQAVPAARSGLAAVGQQPQRDRPGQGARTRGGEAAVDAPSGGGRRTGPGPSGDPFRSAARARRRPYRLPAPQLPGVPGR